MDGCRGEDQSQGKQCNTVVNSAYTVHIRYWDFLPSRGTGSSAPGWMYHLFPFSFARDVNSPLIGSCPFGTELTVFILPGVKETKLRLVILVFHVVRYYSVSTKLLWAKRRVDSCNCNTRCHMQAKSLTSATPFKPTYPCENKVMLRVNNV
jgi:hypothetical protein